MIGTTIYQKTDYENPSKEDMHTLFDKDMDRLKGRVTFNGNPVTKDRLPQAIKDNYFTQFSGIPNQYIAKVNSFDDKDLTLLDPTSSLHYSDDASKALRIEYSNIRIGSINPQKVSAALSLPGTMTFEFKRINNDTYELTKVTASNACLQALIAGQQNVDLESPEFIALVEKAKETERELVEFNAALGALRAALKTEIPTGYDEYQKNLADFCRSCADLVQQHAPGAQKQSPEHTAAITEVLRATTEIVEDPLSEDALKDFSEKVAKIHELNVMGPGTLLGSAFIFVGALTLASVALSMGPVSLGVFGAGAAYKAVSLSLLTYKFTSALSVFSMFTGLPFLMFGKGAPEEVQNLDEDLHNMEENRPKAAAAG